MHTLSRVMCDLVPDPDPTQAPATWELGVLATRPPAMSGKPIEWAKNSHSFLLIPVFPWIVISLFKKCIVLSHWNSNCLGSRTEFLTPFISSANECPVIRIGNSHLAKSTKVTHFLKKSFYLMLTFFLISFLQRFVKHIVKLSFFSSLLQNQHTYWIKRTFLKWLTSHKCVLFIIPERLFFISHQFLLSLGIFIMEFRL